jgi:hypothetical protein
MMEDPIVDEVHRASQILIERHGGVHGWIKHLQAMDRARARKARQRRARRNGKRSAKNSRSSVRARAGTKTLSRTKTRSR